MLSRQAAIFITLLLTTSVAAHDASQVSSQWLRLLHYHHTRQHNYVSPLSQNFFISKNGAHDPAAELSATRIVMQGGESITRNGSSIDAQCAFPARARYLRAVERVALPMRDCPKLREFRDTLPLRSFSVVFATSYAGNAASMFGHTLLKLNLYDTRRPDGPNPPLLDYAIAFSAATDKSEGATYAFKGLTGAYLGYYSIRPYYEVLNEYAFSEGRDLWEVEIPLTGDQREMLLLHLWELANYGQAPYYFTHVNCASMLTDLVEAVRTDLNLNNHMPLAAFPAELMKAVGEELINSEATFRPSLRRIFQLRLSGLDDKQSARMLQIWGQQQQSSYQSTAVDPLMNDPALTDVLLDRITLEKARLALPKQDHLREYEKKVLQKRAALGTGSTPVVPIADNNPILAHPPARVAIGASHDNTDHNNYAVFNARYGWHDILDPVAGFEPYYHLNIFDLTYNRNIKTHDDKWDLQLADVWSLQPYRAADPLWSWTIRADIQRLTGPFGHENLLLFEVAGGRSYEWIKDRAITAILPSVRSNLSDRNTHLLQLGIGMDIITLYALSPQLRSLLVIRPNYSVVDGTQPLSWSEWRWATRYLPDRKHQIEVSVTRQAQVAYELSYGVLF